MVGMGRRVEAGCARSSLEEPGSVRPTGSRSLDEFPMNAPGGVVGQRLRPLEVYDVFPFASRDRLCLTAMMSMIWMDLDGFVWIPAELKSVRASQGFVEFR
jgi:hypothetical protein